MSLHCFVKILCATGLVYLASCKSKQYPCPAYSSRPSVKIDSTGQFVGGYRHNKDKKTGLIVKKKNKNMYDKKGQSRVF